MATGMPVADFERDGVSKAERHKDIGGGGVSEWDGVGLHMPVMIDGDVKTLCAPGAPFTCF